VKKSLFLATALALAGCASTERSGSPAVAQASGSTMYCWQVRLVDAGGNLTCNWETTAAAACDASHPTPISKAAIAQGPDKVRMCNNGQWLVQVTMR
jgi:hypothetical protein